MTDTPGPNDKWALDDGQYSPRNFYTASTDGHGHSDILTCKVSPYMKGLISQMIQQRTIPEYSTYGAFVRDALAHRLKQIAEEFGDTRVDFTANQILMYEHQLARAERRQREEKLVTQLVENYTQASNPTSRLEVQGEIRIAINVGMVEHPNHIAQLQMYLQ